MGLDPGALIKKLDKTCHDGLQAAAGFCFSRTNYSVEVEHWLAKLAEPRDGDLARIFKHFEVDPSHVQRDLTRAIDGFKTGNARTPSLAPAIDTLVREAWLLTSLQFQAAKVRPGVLLLALLTEKELGRQARESSRELAKIGVDLLAANLMKIVAGSGEEARAVGRGRRRRRPAASATVADPGGDVRPLLSISTP